jgi:hypothetical protein
VTATTFPAGPASATDLCSTIAGGHVVTFASEEEYQAVLGYYLDAGADGAPFWVGLEVTQSQTDNGHYTSAAEYEPGWRPDCPGCYAHTPDPTVPLQGNNGFCVEAAPTAHPTAWQSVRCYGSAPLRVLCEREPSTTPGSSQAVECEAGICLNLVWTYPQKTYVYMDIGLPADDAEQSCRSLGGRLVVLGSRDEREQLWYQLSNQAVTAPPVQVWIGLARANVDTGADAAIDGSAGMTSVRAGPWVWDDDASADSYPPQWGAQQPIATGPGISTRAYLQYEPTFSSSTLAVDFPLDPTIGPPAYVCELRGPDAGR